MNISALSCTGKNGKPIYGTAAILHRLFSQEDDAYDKKADMQEYERIIRKCGYAYFND